MKIFINIKSLGKKKALEPAAYEISEQVSSLREFLTELVRIEVERYNEKGSDVQNVLFLSDEEIENQTEAGKVGFGRIYSDKKADFEKAAVNALQCFEDGMVRVFQNENELTTLDEKIQISEGDTFTLMRLTFLAGRLW